MNGPSKDTGPQALLQAAQVLLEKTGSAGRRAASHLIRQALEQIVAQVLEERAPGTEQASFRAQLICLPIYLNDEDLAGRIAYTWSALSRACHHHPYELAPTRSELEGWMRTLHDFVTPSWSNRSD